jgi:hypothetical protein
LARGPERFFGPQQREGRQARYESGRTARRDVQSVGQQRNIGEESPRRLLGSAQEELDRPLGDLSLVEQTPQEAMAEKLRQLLGIDPGDGVEGAVF